MFAIKFLLCHLVGDFIVQSDWMALNKNKKTWPCIVHCLIYTACFLVITTSWKALLFIGVTHFIFDRFPIIIKRLIWTKNHFPNGYPPFGWCSTTGYYDDSPYNTYNAVSVLNNPVELYGKQRHFFVTIWLYIITDNTIHLICNYLALFLFGV